MEFFEKYPDLMISADIVEKKYSIKYTKVIEEFGKFSFDRKHKVISKEKLENIISQIIFIFEDESNETTHSS